MGRMKKVVTQRGEVGRTYSAVNSCVPTGMQYTNCMALQRRWNSMHSSTCMTPLVGGGPRHTGSCRKLRMRVRITSNMDSPQHRRSLVSRSPSRAMAICYREDVWIKEHETHRSTHQPVETSPNIRQVDTLTVTDADRNWILIDD